MTSVSLSLWLLLCFILIPPMKQWLSDHLQGVAFLLTGNIQFARWLFWLVLLPGTFLHELSHWLTAKLLRVKTYHFSIWPRMKPNGWMQMGAIHMQAAIDPFRHSLIGLAPFIFGSMAVLFIGQYLLALDEIRHAINSGNLATVWQTLSHIFTVPIAWLWLYAIFAISNAMFPSHADRQAWRTALLYSALIVLVIIGLGFNPLVSVTMQQLILSAMAALLFAFAITIMVDLLFIIVIGSLEFVLSWAMGRQVVYNR